MSRILMLLLIIAPVLALSGAGKGSTFEDLRVGEIVYTGVTVTSVTPRSIFIKHDSGLAQIMLMDLDPILQKEFGFKPTEAIKYTYEKELEKKELLKKQEEQKQKAKVRRLVGDRAESIISQFGTQPIMREQMDLRPRFNEMRLFSKSQGRRPSCSVFAVMTALEYQNALLRGEPEDLSEEYLIWATRVLIASGQHGGQPVQSDSEGFSLLDVVNAVIKFGVATQDSMPYRYGRSMSRIKAPTKEIIEASRARQKVAFIGIQGKDNEERIANIIHVLNEGMPLAIGLAWPHNQTLQQTNLLSEQVPPGDFNHAVTLVGYKCTSLKIEDTVFIFRNSWGREWGVNGYGFVSYEYLEQHMHNALFLEMSMGSIN